MKYNLNPPLRLYGRLLRSIEINGFGGAVSHSFQRLFRSMKNHGLSGTFERAFVKVPALPDAPVQELQPDPFDLAHGTDTGGMLAGLDFAAASLSAAYTIAYHGIPSSTLRPALAGLPLKHDEFTFVDIGCGKGRALLIAAEFPFRRLVGVEIANAFSDIARANAALRPDWEARISIVNEDAIKFVYPDGPIVLYLYYPFFPKILRRVLANLERQLRHSPRPTYLLYADSYVDPKDLDESYARDPGGCRKVITSFPMMSEIFDNSYPVSAEEAGEYAPMHPRMRYTFYSAQVPR
jgi:SAM-dependent methyltransferase